MAEQVALWFWRNFAMDYEIYDNEEQAAKEAVVMEEYENGTPVGIQFPDGRTVKVEDWAKYKEAEEAYYAREKAKPVESPRPTRLILNPFDGAPMRIEMDEPEWLGVRPETLINRNNTE